MLMNSELQKNDGLDELEEGMKSLKMEISDENGDKRAVLPDRPGEPDCIYFLRTGTCGYGTNCRFNHPSNAGGGGGGGQVHGDNKLPERAGQPDCGYYLKTGMCKYGLTCKYHHPKDRDNDHQPKDSKADSGMFLNFLGLPMRQGSKPCPYYMRTGSCRYGYACKFHHPHPPSAAKPMVPVHGTPAGEHSVMPSSFSPPQAYMPMYLSPLHGWDTYAASASNLPERPDQPECRYYLSHGTCRYGLNCKYHHPKENMLPLLANSLGLPLRPGMPVCSYYTFYGHCNYGLACKFDHPIDRYSYGYTPYSFSIPPLLPTSYSAQYPVPEPSFSHHNNGNHYLGKDLPDVHPDSDQRLSSDPTCDKIN